MRIAIYSRKSVLTEKGESIENQIELCKAYIFSKIPDAADAEIKVYEDEGFSGSSFQRPQFQTMLKDLNTVRFDYLVCYRLDRISRNVGDFAGLIEDLNRRNVSFICIREEFDTSKPMGKAMMYIASVFAQLERETIAERVRDNMLLLARTGRWLGGTTPTGFVSEQTEEVILDGKRKRSCKLKANPAETAVVMLLFDKFFELRSVSGLSKYLIKQDIRSRAGSYYSLPGIKEILQNPVYCTADKDARDYFLSQNADVCFAEAECTQNLGLLSYNKRSYRIKNAPRQSMDHWIIAIGKHKGLIPGKKWVAVQRILEENKPASGKARPHNGYSLLSGRILCKKCGGRMFAKTRSNQENRFDYICGHKLRGGTSLCDCRNLGGRQTDEMVLTAILPYLRETAGACRLLESLKKEIRKQAAENPIYELETNIKKTEEELDALVQSIPRLKPDQAFARRILDRAGFLEQKVNILYEKRDRLLKESRVNSGTPRDADFKSILSLSGCFAGLNLQEKRSLISLVIQRIEWDGTDLQVFICGAPHT